MMAALVAATGQKRPWLVGLLLAPELNEDQFPFFESSVFGMALIMVTSALLYMCGDPVKRLEVTAAVAMGLVMIPHVLHGTIGWTQFGYRFSMDYFPMLVVLTASGMGHRVGIRPFVRAGFPKCSARVALPLCSLAHLEDLVILRADDARVA